MKKLITCFIYATAISLFTLLAGCRGINVDYIGQKYPATTNSYNIEFYNNSTDVPNGKYTTIGRAVAVAPDSYSSKAIKNKLVEKAQICGADAIQVVDFKRVFVSQQVIPEQGDHDNGPVGSWGNRGRRADGSRISVNASGKVVAMRSKVYDRYDLKARVLFLRLKSKSPVQGPIVKKINLSEKEPKKAVESQVTEATISSQALAKPVEKIESSNE